MYPVEDKRAVQKDGTEPATRRGRPGRVGVPTTTPGVTTPASRPRPRPLLPSSATGDSRDTHFSSTLRPSLLVPGEDCEEFRSFTKVQTPDGRGAQGSNSSPSQPTREPSLSTHVYDPEPGPSEWTISVRTLPTFPVLRPGTPHLRHEDTPHTDAPPPRPLLEGKMEV